VGFINPALYNLGLSSNYASALHDITYGNNPPETGGGSGFNAVPGYDLVTGWGSPAGAPLIDQLAGTSANSAGAPAAAAAGSPAASYGRVFMYPKRGQSDAQQAVDLRECSEWAATQTSPGLSKESAYSRAMAACGEARGYTVH
jgi:hypothetical protein